MMDARTGHGHDPMLTPAEVADRLRVSVGWVYDRVKAGELRAHQLGKYLRIRQGDVEAFVDARRVS